MCNFPLENPKTMFLCIVQAHLWIQTMQELRQGVKLKKTDYTKTPIEYELTPYEMLMDDIRSRRCSNVYYLCLYK